MKKIFYGLILLSSLSLNAQETPISVYDCDLYAPPTQSEILSGGSTFTRGCIDLVDPANYTFQQNGSKTLKSGSYIHADAGCHVGPYVGAASMRWQLQPTASPFDVAVMNYDNLDEVEKLKMLELGIQIPADVLTKINNFIGGLGNPATDQLNPFLDWDLDVEAVFANDGLEGSKRIDGFYYRNYERDTSLNDWTDVGTNYPFRVRYSPPSAGLWYCTINIKVKGVYVYFSNPFSFKVIETGAHGYVNVHANNRNLELDGRIIMPIGQNLPFPIKEGHGYDVAPNETNKSARVDAWLIYQQDIIDYQAMGGRFLRTVQGAQSSLIEYEKKGNYYDRLHYAWETDQYMKFCDEHDMLIDFNLLFHEPIMMFSQYDNDKWDFSHYAKDGAGNIYYNAADPYPAYCYNDSGTELASSMFTDSVDLKYHEQRMRYYIARYGYSTSIMQFELLSESWHLDELDHNVVYETSAQGTTARNALANYIDRLTDYTKNTLGHNEHLFGLHGYLTGTDNTHTDPSLDHPDIDVIGFSSYDTRPDKYVIEKPSPNDLDIESQENSYYKSYTGYATEYGKPVIFSEQGGPLILNGLEYEADGCSNFAVRKVDDAVAGFTGIAGFYAWVGFRDQDNTVAWNSTIKSSNWMNDDKVIDVISASYGDWKQGRQIEKHQLFAADRLKENQYYVDHYDENAVGYVYNRSYNYFTKQIDIPCGNIDNDNNNEDDIREDFQELITLDWESGGNLFVMLKPNTNYKITWYDFQTGNYISDDCYGTGLDHRFKLEFPELTVVDAVIDRPVLWYVINEYNCQLGLTESDEREESNSQRNLNLIDDKMKEFLISPNPFIDYITIDIKSDAHFNIFSASNEKVYSGQLKEGKNNLNFGFLASGIYYLKIDSRNEVFKIVKI